MRTLRGSQVLAPEVPADVHELDGIEGTATAPRSGGGVRALALEAVEHRDVAGPGRVAPPGLEHPGDVREQHDVRVLEIAGPYEGGLAPVQFLRRGGPDLERSRQVVALHDALHGQCRAAVHRPPHVVARAVARRAGDNRDM